MRYALRSAALALALVVCGATTAHADVFGPISLVSVNQSEQASTAEHPAISRNGQFVAFDGSFGRETGVWRKDLSTGAVAPVAVGPVFTPQGDAKLPSISADGRWVSFTTTARLDEKDDTNTGPDVYVRDMSNPNTKPCPAEGSSGESCAFTLASAADGSTKGLTYQYNSSGEEPSFGSLASGRSAMSAGGRYVAFVTTATSDLAGEATPPLQVAVRDVSEKRTYLISALYDPSSGGPAIDPKTAKNEPVPIGQQGKIGAVFDAGGIPKFEFPNPAVGASISGDGSTVAWLGQEVALQAPSLPERDTTAELEHAEPLWRRWKAPGASPDPLAPARRVTGGSDPTNPECVADETKELGTTLADPCQGPFGRNSNGTTGIEAASGSDYLPRLSDNGRYVALLSNAPLIEGGEFGSTGNFSDDLYRVDMSDPLAPRASVLRRLTAIAAGGGRDFGRVEPIEDFGISPKGDAIAFSSRRTVFPLGSPSYVSQTLPAPAEESGPQEVYVVDFGDDTLTRVTHGYNGAPTELSPHAIERGFVGSLSFAEPPTQPLRLAFSSLAPNLVYGDGNQASDVFVVDRQLFGSISVQDYISSAPPNPAGDPEWRLNVSARSRRDGTVLLYVLVPGAGMLRASAQSAVALAAPKAAHGSGHRRRSSHTRTATSVAVRTVATAVRSSRDEALLQVPLVLASHYRALALQRGGQSATVSVTFSAPGHPLAKYSLAVTFIAPASSHKKKRAHSRGHK
jgi:hypothetical protein